MQNLQNDEFKSFKSTHQGLEKMNEVRQAFDLLLTTISPLMGTSRHASIVKTKLEEAGFFAVKAVVMDNRAE